MVFCSQSHFHYFCISPLQEACLRGYSLNILASWDRSEDFHFILVSSTLDIHLFLMTLTILFEHLLLYLEDLLFYIEIKSVISLKTLLTVITLLLKFLVIFYFYHHILDRFSKNWYQFWDYLLGFCFYKYNFK